MNYKASLVFSCALFFTSLMSVAQDVWKDFKHLFSVEKTYVVYHTIDDIIIDGINNEQSWTQAEWTEYFSDIEGIHMPEPLHPTRVKMLWNNTKLYIFAELEEPHIWAYYDKHDLVVFHENDFEVFIDPNRDAHNYYEFEVNAQNTLFDLFLPKPYRDGGNPNIKWNARGFKSAVYIDGTLNDPSDVDKKWTVEMEIPISSLSTDDNFTQAENGSVWKINFSRVEWQTEVVDGKYIRKQNPKSKKILPEYNWVWSPQGIINMHFPERWSMIQFSTNRVDCEKEKFQMPVEEEWGKYLWLIYYKQDKFRNENGAYATLLSELGIKEKWEVATDIFELRLETHKNSYEIFLETEKGLKLSINEEGLFKVLSK